MRHTLALLGAVLFLSACSGSEDEPAPVDSINGGAAAPAPGAATEGAPPGETTGTPAPSPNAPPDTAPGTPPAQTPSAGVFANAPAYAPLLGPSTIDTSGKGNGHLSFNAAGNPAGKPCLDCHDGAGKKGAPGFVFAGTIFEDQAGTKPSPRVEVRMVGADGKGLTTHTDANGNFFFRAGAADPAVPATAGARNATTVRMMTNKINDANCNQCHGAASRITL